MHPTRKLTNEELRAAMSPFLHFPHVERSIHEEKTSRMQQAVVSTQSVGNAPGTAEDIVSILSVNTASEFKDRLKLILATSAGSLEMLDMVCMALCPEQTSWMQRRKSPAAIKRIAHFLIDPTSTSGIPWFIAEGFRLPTDWIEQMRSDIAAQIHSSLQSQYNTDMGLALEARIGQVVTGAGYKWEKGFVDVVDQKEVDVVVPELRLPRILIMSSYNLTTASAQSQRAREQKAMYDQVHTYNSAHIRRREPDVQLVNVIDGAGWLARPSDLEEMHQHCDYALSFNGLDLLPEILHYHMRQ